MKLTRKFLSLALLVFLGFSIASCDLGGGDQPGEEVKTYTRNIYTTISPSNWNELTYQDNNDTQIMSYLAGSFFEYDFKFEDGEIVDGQFEVEYSAATKVEDVTSQYVGEQWGIEADAQQRAFKITLRNDLKWDDGTAIDASDFIYTMKEQLNPLFQNYRADSYYNGSVAIHNAKGYAKQGQSGWFNVTDAYGLMEKIPENAQSGVYFSIYPYAYGEGDEEVVTSTMFDYIDGKGYGSYVTAKGATWLLNALYGCTVDVDTLEGKTYTEIMGDPTLKATYDSLIAWWCTEPEEPTWFWVCEYNFPAVEWDQVGFFAPSKYELVIILDKSVELLDESGNLTYHCGYDFGSLPLVKRSLYEECKVAPNASSDLWTSTYNSSVASSASWGPYKLTSFQSGKYYKLERNTYWYGYNMESNEGLYQTDAIECETIDSWNTAFIKFKAGEIDNIGIDVSVSADYKNSERAYFTGDDFISSLQLQSDAAALKANESEGVDKEMLSYVEFRKAISVGLDRDDLCNKTTTASLAGFGLFNSFHYYDVAHGGVYRNSEVAKQVLVDVYAIDVSKYASVDEAIAAMGGANLEEARKLIDAAYAKALEAGTISATDKVVLKYGTSADTESTRRSFNYLNEAIKNMAVGTQLEGRIELEFDSSFGSKWANDFRSGKYEICAGGWSGAAWDPGYFLLAYLSPDYMYSAAWETDKEMMTFTFQGKEYTMSLMDWYDCLNGNEDCAHNWSSAYLTEEERLPLIAALEKAVLSKYYTVPYANYFSASLISYKIEYITYTYNTFMAYGGIKYMTYNYSDAEWEAAVAELGGEIDYTK